MPLSQVKGDNTMNTGPEQHFLAHIYRRCYWDASDVNNPGGIPLCLQADLCLFTCDMMPGIGKELRVSSALRCLKVPAWLVRLARLFLSEKTLQVAGQIQSELQPSN